MFPVGAVMTIMKTSQVVPDGYVTHPARAALLPQWELQHKIID